MTAFIEEHRDVVGVEPICRVLPIAPATYYARAAITRNPDQASDRAKRDLVDAKEIGRVFKASRGRYGARKVWHQLRREKHDIARCTVERLMQMLGLQGVKRGKKRTTIPDPAQPCPDDKVNREFSATAQNQLWISDFTYVSSWVDMVYVAFVIDVFARKIVGWRVSTSMTTGFVLDALNQAICQRCPENGSGLVHHSDRGSQYVSIKYTERLAEAGIDPSVGSVGDSYDNAPLGRLLCNRLPGNAWPKLSLVCSKPRSSTSWVLGNLLAKSNGKPWLGSTGTTQNDCTAPSAMSHPKKQRRLSMKA
jgi:transposase InsO family protein